MVDGPTSSETDSRVLVVRGWPRWAAVVVTVAGVVVVVAETTSFLVIPGLILVGVGVYGFVAGSRARRAASRTRVRRETDAAELAQGSRSG